MASSDNLAFFDAWPLRPMFPESWISDTDILTKALQKSLYNTTVLASGTDDSLSETLTSNSINPLFNLNPSSDATLPPTTPTGSSFSGSEPDTAPSKPHNKTTSVGGPRGKVTKRKSRASKRTQTTFITADPANFRQMVQQVTGVRFGNSQGAVVPVVKPEPQRASNRLQGYLPTLDTSAFLLDHHHHHQQQVLMGNTSGNGPMVGPGPGPGHDIGSAFELDSLASFPTLESNSWKAL